MPRPSNKEQILSAGLDLIYAKGFAASGIQEIADASGVPKGSFYNYFKSKEDFVIEALEHYTMSMSDYLEGALLKARGSPLGNLRKLFEGWCAEFEKRNRCGCFAGNLSQELANHTPAVRRALRRSFNTLEGFYARCLEAARDAGELPAEADTKALAHFVYNSWQGAIVRAKAEGDSQPMRACVDALFGRILK